MRNVISTIHSALAPWLSSVQKPLIVLLGPTASGKTGFSIDLALHLGKPGRGVEIINADSRQLYTHLDIGTAKITKEEMRGIPHHLIDVLDPKEEATAAWYKTEAMRIIDDIHARENIPMLVGGSMLYISAIIDNLDFPLSADPAIRKKLEDDYDRDEGAGLLKRLEEIDPESAAAIPRQNKPYLVRALEMHAVTGQKPSALKTSSASPYDLFIIGIDRTREELVQRINDRTHQLIESGWIEEVQQLMDKGYSPKDPGMKSHGYREMMSFIAGDIPDKKTLMELISSKTRQYAKRQMTWWRNDDRIRWISL